MSEETTPPPTFGDLPSGTGDSKAQGEYVLNPLVPHRADPWVYRHTDGRYYFTGSVPAYDRIELIAAPTLRELSFAEPTVVWRKHDRGPMSWHIWAPELHHIDGRWYLYFAAGRAEAIWDIRIYVLENESPDPRTGIWQEKGQIETNWDSFSLDATTFAHRGVRYLVWAQKDPAIAGNTNLYIAAMENPWTIRGRQALLTRPEFDWETAGFLVNEGPAVLHRNGRLFLTYSAAATDERYCMGLLTAYEGSDLLDPASWTKAPRPVFESSATNRQFGPGHNSFTTTADGTGDVLIYHARPYRQIVGDPLYDPNRQARAQRIAWAVDGTPDFGGPVPDGPHFFG
jgi:GH43 family beta-xylosidase